MAVGSTTMVINDEGRETRRLMSRALDRSATALLVTIR